MILAVQITGILFMLTLMFIGIWSFVLANKAYNQIKYKNYLLEKISNRLAILTETAYDSSISFSNLTNSNIDAKEEILDTYDDLLTNEPIFTDEALESSEFENKE